MSDAPWDVLEPHRMRLTKGLVNVDEARFDAALKQGFEIVETYSHTSEAGHSQSVTRYERDGVSLVEVETYIEREGGMHMRATLGPEGWGE